MNDVNAVQVVDSLQNLAHDLRGILLGEFSILANAIKQFTARRKLSNDIIFILPRESQPRETKQKRVDGPMEKAKICA